MSLDFNILHNLEATEEWLDSIKVKAVLGAARAAINKTLRSTRVFSVKAIAKQYRLKPSGLSRREVKSMMKVKKARGGSLNSLEGQIKYDTTPIPILKFISGAQEIIKQKGIKVKKRRRLRAEIRPGKKILLKGAFIQRVHSKQVFKRGRAGFKKQGVASIGQVIMRDRMKILLLNHVASVFEDNFKNQLQFRLDKLATKLNNSKLK